MIPCQVTRDLDSYQGQVDADDDLDAYLEGVEYEAAENAIKALTDAAAAGDGKPMAEALDNYEQSFVDVATYRQGLHNVSDLLAKLLTRYAAAVKIGRGGEFPTEVQSLFGLVSEHAANEAGELARQQAEASL